MLKKNDKTNIVFGGNQTVPRETPRPSHSLLPDPPKHSQRESWFKLGLIIQRTHLLADFFNTISNPTLEPLTTAELKKIRVIKCVRQVVPFPKQK